MNEKSPIQPDCKLHACSFETSFHVFFHCQFARKLWKKVEWWKSIKVASNGKTSGVLLHLFSSLTKNQFEFCCVLSWEIMEGKE